ncbi:helix-turn-helix transcriptional regulator [Streptomyces sp. NPDC050439]|uniref:helix-turn-helix domain-containing protein n=1 Tax=unclassified Streptomyces TaxID=2593676 RepID=UPI00343E228B
MGRPESPVGFAVQEVGMLAAYLRQLRQAVGKTYEELADSALCSASSLKRAARGGERAPAWTTVEDYVTAAGGDLVTAKALHQAAKGAAARARRDARRSMVVPKPQFVRDAADLSGAMRDAYDRAGRPPVREMEDQAGWRLPHSTAHEIVRGRALPYDVRTYIAFLQACEIQEDDLGPWFECWHKVRGERTRTEVNSLLAARGALRPGEELFVHWYETTKKSATGIEIHAVRPLPLPVVPEHRSHHFAGMTLQQVLDLAAQNLAEEGDVGFAA